MEIFRLESLNFSYPNTKNKTLDNININVNEGEFVLISGKSGCGKSTLLKHFKPELNPCGEKIGNIYYKDKDIDTYKDIETSTEIGYVFQNPDAQLVTDKVWHEIAFGLENMGMDPSIIRLKVAEISSFFGMNSWFRKNVDDLSGGQKQLLNLASIMIMEPKVLILDEPTSQLDPIASREFIDILIRINKEFSTTIIITEHNLEDIYSVCDKVVIMDDGHISYLGTPQSICKSLVKNNENNMIKSLPTSFRIFNELKDKVTLETYPLTIREGRMSIKEKIKIIKIDDIKSLDNDINNKDYKSHNEDDNKKNILKNIFGLRDKPKKDENIVLELKDVYFKYSENSHPTLNNLTFKVREGEIYSILGANGSGKSTTLSVICKNNKHQRGNILINNKNIKKMNNKELFEENIALLPQNPQSLFVFETVKEDLIETLKNKNIDEIEKEKQITKICEILEINNLLNHHPYDLSGGELQRVALAKILLLKPKILLLDEVTKGLDAYSKENIQNILIKLKNMGVTIIIVTHDIEFSSRISDRCSMFFDGSIISENNPRDFFSSNNFYTTYANKMSKNIFKGILSYEDVVKLCQVNL